MRVSGRTKNGLVYIGLLGAIGTVQAATVSVVGGFTGYNGPAGGCGSFKTTINGQNVTPSTGCDFSSATAQISDTFPTTDSVEFFERAIGDSSDGTHNLVSFEPANPQIVPGLNDEFLLGTLTFTNGVWFGVGPVATFHFTLTTASSNPALNGKTFDDSLTLYITPNDFVMDSPADNADFLYFMDLSFLGSTRVFELNDSPTHTNTATFDVYGMIDDLVPTRFANAQGAGFIDPGIGAAPTSAAPEPATSISFGLGLAALIVRRIRLKGSESSAHRG